MTYAELITKALKEKKVNAAAKQWGLTQSQLDRYARGQALPTFKATLILAKEAGMSVAEAVKILAEEETKRRSKVDKLSEGFKTLLRFANVGWMRVPATA